MVARPSTSRLPAAFGHVPFYARLPAQLMVAALLPIILVSVLIGVPLIEGRRAQLLKQEHLRAEQAAHAAELLYRERLGFATLLATLLADRPVLIQSLSAGNDAGLQEFVQQTRNDTLFDLVTIVDSDGRILAQDGMASLWRPTQVSTDRPLFWSVPDIGLVVQVASPIVREGEQRATLVGSFLIDRALLGYVRAQTNLDQSVLFDAQVVATSLARRAAQSPGPLGGIVLGDAPTSAEVLIGDAPYLVHYLPLATPGGRPMGTIEVLLPLTPVRNARRDATAALLGGTVVAASIAVWLGWYLAQRLTRPIRRLSTAAVAIGRGHLDQPVPASGPAEIRLFGWTLDHMRRQLAESRAALQAEKARYANILESIEEAVIILDPEERITGLNRSAETLFGIDRTVAQGRTLSDIVRRDDDRSLALVQIPAIGVVQLALRTSDGDRLLVAATRSEMMELGTPASEHVIVLRDVGEEQAVRQLKDAFLANVTHELRTPLAALIASLEILRDEHQTMTADEQTQMLDALHSGVHRLDALVQNLLDSASIEAGYFRVDPEVHDLLPLVDEAVALVRPLVQQRRQTLVVERPEALPPVLADGQRVVQALVNLLSNASKFGPRGDRIVLAVTGDAGCATLRVTDHGVGIAPGRQARLFERFLRPSAETVKAQGAGLGLAIVKAIVERHGGVVTVHSDADGTSFCFTLPAATELMDAHLEGP